MRIRYGLISFVLAFAANAQAGQMEVDVALSPAGSFKAQTAKVKGTAYKTADGVKAENVIIEMSSLQTGIALRDKHMKQRLNVKEYPEARLVKAVGKNGKGHAVIEIRGQKQEVKGTYKIEDGHLKAEFQVHLPDLKISDVRYMGVGVRDDVTIHVTLPIKNAPARASASE